MTNFDFLRSEKRFASFAGAAAAAEMIFPIDTAACAVNVRRAMELTVKWMFENDRHLTMPKRDSLASMLKASDFCAVVGSDMSRKLDFIRQVGNNAAHNPGSVTKEHTALSLRHLFDFENFVAGRYRAHKAPYPYDETLLIAEEEIVTEALDTAQIGALVKENRSLKRMLRSLQAVAKTSSKPEAPAPLSEADTRRLYVETDLAYVGWRMGVDCFSEYRIDTLPAGSGVGYADYVLFHENCPLAVVESQSAADDPAIGRQQAKLYADALEKKFGHRPVIFLTGGSGTRIWQDTLEPERPVAGIYSQKDLLRIKALAARRQSATDIPPRPADCPADRPYQRQAVSAVLEAFCQKGQRTVCLSLAPGTGKTRTALAAAWQLCRMGWAKHILYLTGNALLNGQVAAASREFPDLRCAALSDNKAAADADVLIASCDALLAEADDLYDGDTHLLTPGRFDLILVDEADAVLAQKHRGILDTFDARLLLLSSAPLPEENTVFTYTHAQAVTDGWVTPFRACALQTAFLTDGLSPKDLSPADRRTYQTLFQSRGLTQPDHIPPGKMFSEYVPEDTVRLMLEALFRHGIQRNGLPGKTIIFTDSHAHSERIYALAGKLYPKAPPHFCRVLDLSTNYPETLLSDFADEGRMPRIALSHDLLRDGVDIPAVENLVFFTRVTSRTAFWRMLGRGMRQAPGKKHFFVLDMYDNFQRFADADMKEAELPLPAEGRLFSLRVQLAQALQSLTYAGSCEALRNSTVRELQKQMRLIPREDFFARRKIGLLDRFSHAGAFAALSPEDVSALSCAVAPLLPPSSESAAVLAFDERMLQLMLARTQRRTDAAVTALLNDLVNDVRALAGRASLKKVARQKKLLNRILHNGYAVEASLPELEEIRLALRPLIPYLPAVKEPIPLPFADRLIDVLPIDPPCKPDSIKKF